MTHIDSSPTPDPPLQPSQTSPPSWQSPSEEDTIDLLELWRTFMKYKWWIIGLCLVSMIGAVIYAKSLPKQYKASVTFLQISGNSGSDLGKWGALASLAGVSLPSRGRESEGVGNIDVILNSRTFTEKIVRELDLLPIIYKDVYDSKTGAYAMKKQPTPLDGAGTLLGAIHLDSTPERAKRLNVVWDDPDVAAKIANYYLAALDKYLSQNTLTATQRTLKFVQKQLKIVGNDVRHKEEALRTFSEQQKLFKVADQASLVSGALSKLKSEKALAQVEQDVLMQFQSKDSLAIQKIKARLKALDDQINRWIEGDPSKEEIGVDIPFNTLPRLGLRQKHLEMELSVHQEIYKILRTQMEQAKIAVSKESETIKVIDPALAPETPFKPKIRKVVALSGIVALFFGFFSAFFIEFIQKTRNHTSE